MFLLPGVCWLHGDEGVSGSRWLLSSLCFDCLYFCSFSHLCLRGLFWPFPLALWFLCWTDSLTPMRLPVSTEATGISTGGIYQVQEESGKPHSTEICTGRRPGCTSARWGSRGLQSFIYLLNPGYQTPVIVLADEIDSRGCWGQGYVLSIIQPSRV